MNKAKQDPTNMKNLLCFPPTAPPFFLSGLSGILQHSTPDRRPSWKEHLSSISYMNSLWEGKISIRPSPRHESCLCLLLEQCLPIPPRTSWPGSPVQLGWDKGWTYRLIFLQYWCLYYHLLAVNSNMKILGRNIHKFLTKKRRENHT